MSTLSYSLRTKLVLLRAVLCNLKVDAKTVFYEVAPKSSEFEHQLLIRFTQVDAKSVFIGAPLSLSTNFFSSRKRVYTNKLMLKLMLKLLLY